MWKTNGNRKTSMQAGKYADEQTDEEDKKRKERKKKKKHLG